MAIQKIFVWAQITFEIIFIKTTLKATINYHVHKPTRGLWWIGSLDCAQRSIKQHATKSKHNNKSQFKHHSFQKKHVFVKISNLIRMTFQRIQEFYIMINLQSNLRLGMGNCALG